MKSREQRFVEIPRLIFRQILRISAFWGRQPPSRGKTGHHLPLQKWLFLNGFELPARGKPRITGVISVALGRRSATPTMSSPPTILVLGASGFTGQLAVRYLAYHREKNSFRLLLAGRSRQKLEALADELGLDSKSCVVELDVTNEEQVAAAVLFILLINTLREER